MRIQLTIATVVLSILPVPSYSQPPAKGDLPALQGRWKMWHDSEDYILLEIKNDTYTYLRHFADGKESTWGGTFTLDEKTTPKQMTQFAKNSEGQSVVSNRCIYELNGDTLLHCGGGPDERPVRFYSAGAKVGIYKRAKAGD
jgi:uncharacterized protein (TIGR03067 family)